MPSPQRPKKIENLLQVIYDCLEQGKYRDTSQAKIRKQERCITLPEIIYVLKHGRHEKTKDKFEGVIHGIMLLEGKL